MCYRFTVKGLVQGVGYRPFIAYMLSEMGCEGTVRNTSGIVTIEARMNKKAAEDFSCRLYNFYPEGARIDSVTLEEIEDKGFKGVNILTSDELSGGQVVPLLPVDLPPCEKCVAEIRDKTNRRYRYPFNSCVACGPRYSIMKRTPYDRINTSMDKYPMCDDCRQEYKGRSVDKRRFYAQTISCPNCGMELLLRDVKKENHLTKGNAALDRAIELLKAGKVLAIKDTGGYHFVCDGTNDEAVAGLRKLKKREDKPFAIVTGDVNLAKRLAQVNDKEEELLKSNIRPIVLLKKSASINASEHEKVILSDLVSIDSPYVGVMLPSSALFVILCNEFSYLVSTSANYQGSPIIIKDEDINQFDVPVLYHEREILTPVDDSIMRVVAGKTQVLRRGRGLVPAPIELSCDLGHVLAMGADMKGTFAYSNGKRVYLSQYFGDLLKEDNYQAYLGAINRFSDNLRLSYNSVIVDKHPLYQSRVAGEELALDINKNCLTGKESAAENALKSIFHHQAHIASVAAEHNLEGEYIGFSLDGTGLGEDGSVWGGECFACSDKAYTHVGGLLPIKMTGGDNASLDPAISLSCYVSELIRRKLTDEAVEKSPAKKTAYDTDGKVITVASEDLNYIEDFYKILEKANKVRLEAFDKDSYELINGALGAGINTIYSSSCGRLFDAVAMLLGASYYNDYDARGPVKLECMASGYLEGFTINNNIQNSDQETDNAEELGFDYSNNSSLELKLVTKDGNYYGDVVGLIADILAALSKGISAEILAVDFHKALAKWTLEMVSKISDDKGEKLPVVLSGGCYGNRLLLEMSCNVLSQAGHKVYFNQQVPPGDDGIALGQLWLG